MNKKPSTNFVHEYSNGRQRIRAFVAYSWMVSGCSKGQRDAGGRVRGGGGSGPRGEAAAVRAEVRF
jgi:hypothetical protein